MDLKKILFLISTKFILADSLTKHAFQVGQVGEKFGEDCSKETEQWEREGDGAIWGCSFQWGCAVSQEYRARFMVDDFKIMHIIPNVTREHFGNYNCQTNPFNIGPNENQQFEHQVTVYEGLQCKDNVTEYKAGELIEIQCTVLQWGDGIPDLRFFTQNSDGTRSTQSVKMMRDKSSFTTIKLSKKHHGKRIGCSFLGFDTTKAVNNIPDCWITEAVMNILYAPTINLLPQTIRTAGEGNLLDFACDADGNPTPALSLFINGNQKLEGNKVEATRTLHNVTCIASNSIGSDSKTQMVNVLSFTLIYPEVRVTDGDLVKLGCQLEQSNGQKEPIFVERAIDQLKLQNKESFVTMDSYFDEKKLKCLALDERGSLIYEKTATNPMTVLYGPYINCSKQSSKRESDGFEITCFVKKNPHPIEADIKLWIKLDQELKRPTSEILWKTYDVRDKKSAVVITVARSYLRNRKTLKVIISVGSSVRNDGDDISHEVIFKYEETESEMDIGLIAGASVGAALFLMLVILWILLVVKGSVCKKKISRKETKINAGELTRRARDDARDGTPPVTLNGSMNGYVNQVAPNDHGLVFANLNFTQHQPRSRAPIVDFNRYEFELDPNRLAAV